MPFNFDCRTELGPNDTIRAQNAFGQWLVYRDRQEIEFDLQSAVTRAPALAAMELADRLGWRH